MATLKEPVKIFIVQSLACRDTPQEVAELVKQEFGVDIDRVQVATYDPTKVAGKNLSKKYVELFEKTRDEFDKGLIDIPIANKYYRLKQYQRQLEKTRNVKTALKFLSKPLKTLVVNLLIAKKLQAKTADQSKQLIQKFQFQWKIT
ncbi:hypothetical protein BANRA_03395 [Acinetobacter baumannii]|nr:hypothetical protein BANRA_00227 [Acinetobacter baumannii]VCX77358.1 hypothetical protein BANRA_03395 [Acinetobacter baumannii]